jgi:hypothetical protein
MDHWSFPIGTRLWKQFTRDDVRVETRMLWRFGAGVGDWVMATYQWPLPVGNEPPDPELATLVSTGVMNANGTLHDIPATGACTNCHGKLSERVLGFKRDPAQPRARRRHLHRARRPGDPFLRTHSDGLRPAGGCRTRMAVLPRSRLGSRT